MGTSHARRRRLSVVEPTIPTPHEPDRQEPSPPPAGNISETPQLDSADQEGLDASLSGMALLLHLTLRLMKESNNEYPRRRRRR
jgi:hypothetical protein